MTQPTPAFRTFGFWMAVPLAALQAVNAARAIADPQGFAAYFGAPLAGGGEAWVHVYALRTAFIALVVGGLLVRRDLAALALVSTVALVMPAGDVVLAYGAGAPTSIVLRHGLVLLYVAVTAFALSRAARAIARDA